MPPLMTVGSIPPASSSVATTGPRHVLWCMADMDRCAHRAKALDNRTLALVRALDLIAEVQHDFGYAAHANAADADKMNRTHIERDACHALLRSPPRILTTRVTISL